MAKKINNEVKKMTMICNRGENNEVLVGDSIIGDEFYTEEYNIAALGAPIIISDVMLNAIDKIKVKKWNDIRLTKSGVRMFILKTGEYKEIKYGKKYDMDYITMFSSKEELFKHNLPVHTYIIGDQYTYMEFKDDINVVINNKIPVHSDKADGFVEFDSDNYMEISKDIYNKKGRKFVSTVYMKYTPDKQNMADCRDLEMLEPWFEKDNRLDDQHK